MREATTRRLLLLALAALPSCSSRSGAVAGGLLHGVFEHLGSRSGSSSNDRCERTAAAELAGNAGKGPKVERYHQCIEDCAIETYACMPHASPSDMSAYVARKQVCDDDRARCERRCVLDVAPPDAQAGSTCDYCIDICRCPGSSIEAVMPCICSCRQNDHLDGKRCDAAPGELDACLRDFAATSSAD